MRLVLVGHRAEKLIAEWVAVNRRGDWFEPVRGYVARHEMSEIDTERVRREAVAASELAERFLSEG